MSETIDYANPSLVNRARRIASERGVTAVTALRLAQGEMNAEEDRRQKTGDEIGTPGDRPHRWLEWMHGDTADRRDAMGHVWVAGEQVAAAVLMDAAVQEITGAKYHVLSSLPVHHQGAATLPPLMANTKADAERWLTFIADLVEGLVKK